MKNKNSEVFVQKFQDRDRLGSLIGSKIISVNEKECLSEYQVLPEHYNPGNVLHGGALYTAMDSNQGAMVHFILDEKFKAAVTGTATIKYLAPLREGKIQIRSWIKDIQDRKIFVSSSACASDGKEVATLEEIWIALLK